MSEVALDFSKAVPIQKNTSNNIHEKIAFYANKNGVPVKLALAQANQESGFKTDAVSPKGAQGLFQLMPDTAKELGVTNPFDPDQNIDAGTKYLKNLFDQYGDWKTALAAYNAGPGNVEKYGGVPPFPETQNYVSNILGANPIQTDPVTLDFSKAVPITQNPDQQKDAVKYSEPSLSPANLSDADRLSIAKYGEIISDQIHTPSKLEAIVRGALNMASLGLAPYAQALTEKKDTNSTYTDALFKVESRNKRLKETYPLAYGLGQGVGVLGGPAAKAFSKISNFVAPVGSGLIRRGLGLGLGSAALSQTQLPHNASLETRATDAAINTALGVPLEGLSTMAGVGTQLLLNKGKGAPGQFAKDVYPNAIEAQQVLSNKGLEVPLSPSDATKGAGKGAVQGLFEASPFSRGVARNFGDKQNQALNRAAEWLEQNQGITSAAKVGSETGLGLSKPSVDLVDESLVAKTVADRINKVDEAFKSKANSLYSKVDEVAQNIKFVPDNTLNGLSEVKKEINKGVINNKDISYIVNQFYNKFTPKPSPNTALLDALGKPLLSSATKELPKVQFANLQAFRSEIGGEIGKAVRAGDNNAARLLYKIKAGIDADLESLSSKMAEQGNPQAAQALQEANQFYKTYKDKFKADIVDQVVDLVGDSKSVQAGKAINSAIKDGNWEQIVKLKNIVGEDGFQPIRQSFVQNMLRGGKEGYDIVGGTLKSQNNPLKQRLSKVNPRVLNEMLGAEDATVLQALADIAPYAKSAEQALQNPRNIIRSGIGTVGVLGGGGAIGGVVGGLPGLAIAVSAAGANNLLARAFYSEPVRNLIITGYRPGLKGEALRRFSITVLNSLSGDLENQATVNPNEANQ